eukprot:1139976-Pelagomonas_calceolata.AAC.2
MEDGQFPKGRQTFAAGAVFLACSVYTCLLSRTCRRRELLSCQQCRMFRAPVHQRQPVPQVHLYLSKNGTQGRCSGGAAAPGQVQDERAAAVEMAYEEKTTE